MQATSKTTEPRAQFLGRIVRLLVGYKADLEAPAPSPTSFWKPPPTQPSHGLASQVSDRGLSLYELAIRSSDEDVTRLILSGSLKALHHRGLLPAVLHALHERSKRTPNSGAPSSGGSSLGGSLAPYLESVAVSLLRGGCEVRDAGEEPGLITMAIEIGNPAIGGLLLEQAQAQGVCYWSWG